MLKKLLLIFLFIFIFSISCQADSNLRDFQRDTAYSLDFESVGGYTTSIPEFTDESYDYFQRTDGSNIGGESFENILGTYYFAAQDIDGEGATLPVNLFINDINISGLSSLSLNVYLAEDDASNDEDWDASDYVHFLYDIDNTGTFSDLLFIESAGSSNTEPLIDTNFDGTGDGTEITNTFTEFTTSITGTGSQLDIKIVFDLDSEDEDIAIDNIVIIGHTSNPEPDNHVTGFSASANGHDAISLSWTDAIGENLSSGYLIKKNTTNLFYDPVDRTPIANDATNMNIAYGNEGAEWTGLESETEYFFKIWSYSNSGPTIDYKTDPSGPTASATTQATPVVHYLILSELCDPLSSYKVNRFIEITNIGSTSQNLSGWNIVAVGNGTDIFTWNLSGIIAPGQSYVCGDDQATGFTVDFVESAWSTSNSNWNGGDGNDGAKLNNNSREIVDQIIATSNLFENRTLQRNANVTNASAVSNPTEWDFSSVTNASDATPGTHITDNPLPVTLSSFTAQYLEYYPVLCWVTQTESNNLGWNVYRSLAQDLSSALQINPDIIEGAGTTSAHMEYLFIDEYSTNDNTEYHYWIESIDFAGFTEVYGPIGLYIPEYQWEGDDNSPTMMEFYGLGQNYPNPFNPSTSIRLKMPNKRIGSLNIYNIKGQLVRTLLDGHVFKKDEMYVVHWDGTDNSGKLSSAGIYCAVFKTGNQITIRKMIMIK